MGVHVWGMYQPLSFLRREDYLRLIDGDSLDEILRDAPGIIGAVEEEAKIEVETYLAKRYNLSECFRLLKPFVSGQTYALGEVVVVKHAAWVAGEYQENAIVYDLGTLQVYRAKVVTTQRPIGGIDWESLGYEGYIAVCTQAGAATEEPCLDSGRWELKDPRHSMVIQLSIDIALYHLFSRVNPRKIQELRIKRYDDAIRVLKAVASGNLDLFGLREHEAVAGKSFGFLVRSKIKRENWI